MIQKSFLPIQITHQEPFGGDSADLKLVGYTFDRIKYAIKRESDSPALPISEWIGHHLCRIAGVPTPEFSIVSCVDEEIAFGSRWEESAIQITAAMPDQDKILHLSSHASDISAIHAIDRAYANPDRHAGNLLFVSRAGTQICLAFDFSRAGAQNGGEPFGVTPLASNCPTYALIKVIDQYLNAFDQAAYSAALARLENASRSDFERILDSAPEEWYVAISKDVFLSWWDNHRSSRFMEARK